MGIASEASGVIEPTKPSWGRFDGVSGSVLNNGRGIVPERKNESVFGREKT